MTLTPDSLPLQRFRHEAMTTTFELIVADPRPEYCRQASLGVFNEITRIQDLLNRHDPGTDLAQINRLQPGEWLRVSMEVVECLEVAAEIYLLTEGAYDAAFRSRQGGRVSAMENLMIVRPDVEETPTEPAEFLVGIDASADAGFSGAELDLGAIGKGFALDKALPLLREWGLDNALLSSTSTVLAMGPGPEHDGWTVRVGADYPDPPVQEVALRDNAISGSGTEVKGEHILDPTTSAAAAGHLSTWVRYRTATASDALSTAFMIMGEEAVRGLLVGRPDIAVLAAPASGQGLYAANWS